MLRGLVIIFGFSRGLRQSALSFALVMAACAGAAACNVPVFRYALERWRPDPYRLTVFKRGTLSAADEAIVARLEAASGVVENPLTVKFALRVVDVESLDDDATRKLDAERPS